MAYLRKPSSLKLAWFSIDFVSSSEFSGMVQTTDKMLEIN